MSKPALFKAPESPPLMKALKPLLAKFGSTATVRIGRFMSNEYLSCVESDFMTKLQWISIKSENKETEQPPSNIYYLLKHSQQSLPSHQGDVDDRRHMRFEGFYLFAR